MDPAKIHISITYPPAVIMAGGCRFWREYRSALAEEGESKETGMAMTYLPSGKLVKHPFSTLG